MFLLWLVYYKACSPLYYTVHRLLRYVAYTNVWHVSKEVAHSQWHYCSTKNIFTVEFYNRESHIRFLLIWTFSYMCTCVSMHVCMFVFAFLCVCMYVCACVCVFVYVYIFICMYVCDVWVYKYGSYVIGKPSWTRHVMVSTAVLTCASYCMATLGLSPLTH